MLKSSLPRKHFDHRGAQCLNCHTPLDLSDRYCHQCGQLNTTKRLALRDFIQEFFANFLSYDSKIWSTITFVLFKPGVATREYCRGKRARFANPFRFFLTVSIVFFLILQLSLTYSLSDTIESPTNGSLIEEFSIDIDSTQANPQLVVQELKAKKDSLRPYQNTAERWLTDQIVQSLDTNDIQQELAQKFVSQSELDELSYVPRYLRQLDDYMDYSMANKSQTATEALQELQHNSTVESIERYRKGKRLGELIQQPTDLLGIILPKIPFFLFFFAPVVSLFFSLIYWRGRWNYMEHMVFNFHLLTFVFLVMFIGGVENTITDSSWINSLLFLILGPLYLYKALRNFYQQGRVKTIIKFLLINFVFLTLLMISAVLFVLGSLLMSV